MDKERGEGKSGWGFVFGSSGGFGEGQVTRSENLDYFGGKVARSGNLGGFGEGQVTRSENLDYFGGRLRGVVTWVGLGGPGYAERKPGLLWGGKVGGGGNVGGFGGGQVTRSENLDYFGGEGCAGR
jgi:hypothetical protein